MRQRARASSNRRVVTALGDPVNVAARLQDMTRSLGCDVVIAEDVCRRAIPPERFVGWREAATRAVVAA